MENIAKIYVFFEQIAKKTKNAENRPEKTRACDHTNLALELQKRFWIFGGALGPIFLGAPGPPQKEIGFFTSCLLNCMGFYKD